MTIDTNHSRVGYFYRRHGFDMDVHVAERARISAPRFILCTRFLVNCIFSRRSHSESLHHVYLLFSFYYLSCLRLPRFFSTGRGLFESRWRDSIIQYCPFFLFLLFPFFSAFLSLSRCLSFSLLLLEKIFPSVS